MKQNNDIEIIIFFLFMTITVICLTIVGVTMYR